MRVCYAGLSYPFGGGGISSYINYVAHALAEQGHEVHIIVVGDITSVEHDKGVTIHRHAFSKRMLHLNSILFWPIVARSFLISKVISQLEREGPLIVEFPDHGALGLIHTLKSRLLRSPSKSIVKLHTSTKIAWLFGNLTPNISIEAMDILERIPIKLADGLTAPSADIARVSQVQYEISRPIETVPYPIDTDFWAPNPEPLSESISENPEIIFAGRFEERKGIDILLCSLEHIWQRHQHTTITLVGSSLAGFGRADFRDAVERKIKSLSSIGKIRIFNWLTKEELRELYRHATLAVVPSRYESFSYACLEPMSCGTPVIASRVGGIPSVVGESGGLLVPPEDYEALADAVCRLLDNPRELNSIRTSARQRAVDNFSYQAIAPRTTSFYDSLL